MEGRKISFHDFYICLLLVITITQSLAKNGGTGDYESRRYETDNSGSTGKTYGSFDGLGLGDSNDKKKSGSLSSYSSSSTFSEDSGKKDKLSEPLIGVDGNSGKKLDKFVSDISVGEDFGSIKRNSGSSVGGISDNGYGSHEKSGVGSDAYVSSLGLTHKKIADYGESGYAKSSGNYGVKSAGDDGFGAQGYDGGDVKSGYGGSVSINKGSGTLDYGAKYTGSSGYGAKGRDSDFSNVKGYGAGLAENDDSGNIGYGNGDDSYGAGSGTGYGHKQLGSQGSFDKSGDYGGLLSKSFDRSDKLIVPESSYSDNKKIDLKESSLSNFEEEDLNSYKPNSEEIPISDKSFSGEQNKYSEKGAGSKTSEISGKDYKSGSSDGKAFYGEEIAASKNAGEYGSGKTEYASDEFAYNSGKDVDSYSNKFYGGIKPEYGDKSQYGSDEEGGYAQGASRKQLSSGGSYKSSQSSEFSGIESNSILDSQNDYDNVEDVANPSVCKGETDFAPHPTECNKFYQCANGKPFIIVCPQGLMFNSKYHICDWPSNVDCKSDSDIPVLHLPSSRHPRDMLAKPKSKTPPPPKPLQSPPHQSKPTKAEPVKLQSMSEYHYGEDSSGGESSHSDSNKKIEEEENDVSYYVSSDEGQDYEESAKGDDWGKTYSAPAQGSSQESVCSSGAKYIRHPGDCTKFFQCAHSKPFLMSCPAGLYFNTDLDVCDWPSNVDCSGSSQTRQSTGQDYESGYSESQPSYHKEGRSTSYTPTVYSSPSYSGEDSKSQESHQQPSFDSSRSSGSYPGGHSMPGYFPMSPFHYPVMPVFHPPIFQPIIPYYPKQSGSQSSTSNNKGDDGDEEEGGKKESQDNSDSKYYQDDSSQSFDQKQTSEDSFYQQGFKDGSSTKVYRRPQKTSNSNNKGFYYYDYDSASNNRNTKKTNNNYNNNNRKGESGSNQKGIYYYYYDNSNKNSNTKQGDYAYYYDYDTLMNNNNNNNNNYDYFMYDYGGASQDYGTSNGNSKGNYNKRKQLKNGALSQPQYFGGAFKELSKNKNLQQSLKKINDVNDDVEYVHFDHTGSGSSKGQGSMGGSDLSSILPLILLGSAQGQQLILTSALLSKLKGATSSMGSKGGNLIDTKGLLGGGGKGGDSLLKTLFLLRLLSPQTTTTTTTGTGTNITPTPNIQFANPGFVTIAGGAPVVFIDPVTGQPVPDTQVAIDPVSGAVFDITTNRVLLFTDPTTGQLVQAYAAPVTTVPLGRTFNPVTNVISRALTRNPLTNLIGGRNNNNRLISVVPGPTVAPPSGTTPARDPINLIFLSPLTPSSLPPPLQGNDGSATMIRGSLREILGDDLTRFLNSAQLIPGQGLPNSPAGSQRSCTVIRSGETVPYRVSPRAGRTLTTEECQAMGQLLDKFIPTFLQNFVPSDAAFAGFGSNNRNRVTPLQPSPSTSDASVNDIFGGGLNTISPALNRPDGGPASASNLSQFINIRNDRDGCTIAVPNIVPQC